MLVLRSTGDLAKFVVCFKSTSFSLRVEGQGIIVDYSEVVLPRESISVFIDIGSQGVS